MRFALSFFVTIVLTIQAVAHEQFNPQGLFLTWQRDPATTMTVQWLEPGVLLPVKGKETGEPFLLPRLGDKLEPALAGKGFAVEFLASARQQRFDDFSGTARMGWSEKGLLMAFTVREREFAAPKERSKPWTGSSIELVLAARPDARKITRLAWIPETTGRGRCDHFANGTTEEAPDIATEVQRGPDGYTLIALIPWHYLPEVEPRTGAEFCIQFYLNTVGRRLAWYPSDVAGVNARYTYRVRLADTASPAYRFAAQLKQQKGALVCEVFAPLEKAGGAVKVDAGDGCIVSGILQKDEANRVASALIPVPFHDPHFRPGIVEVELEGNRLPVTPQPRPEDYAAPETVTILCRPAGSGQSPRRLEVPAARLKSWPGVFLRRVELTGLSPDTLYEVFQEGKEGRFTFRTMPKALSRPLRIAIGGDTMHRPHWLEQSNRVAVQHDPDFVLWGGDLADTNARDDLLHRWHDWFAGVAKTLRTAEGRVVPVVVAIGNHDVKDGYCEKHAGYQPTDAWRETLAPQFYELFAFPGQPGYGVLDFGTYLSVVILDSGHTNPIPGAQTEWLEQTLKARTAVPHVLPVYHIPAYPSVKNFDGKYETLVRQTWTPLFDRYRVRSAFEHHNHAYKRTHPILAGKVQEGGTVYFGDGGWGITPRPVHPVESTWYLAQALPTRYVLMLTLAGEEQHFHAYNDKGELIDQAVVRKP